MTIQYYIVSIIVICVIVWQYFAYKANENRIERLRKLFPSSNNSSVVNTNETTTIYCEDADGDFKETLDDINSYLVKNNNKTFDYHILKEIVDRKSQSLEEEVDTMLSTPLYLGLIATIFGIAFGVVMFAWKDLANLLSGVEMNPEGIKILLTDVGIAMTASLFGVLFTKLSTSDFNTARSLMVQNKNRFLTWIQTDLMSKLSDDITGAIIKMTNDLNEFNRTFSDNTKELKETLSTVNNNYEGQIKLLEEINKLKISKIANANIEVYDRLKGCTDELENLFTILADSETYVKKVTELNEKLGDIEHRTKLFEELGIYFKSEGEYVKDRQGHMRQAMSQLDSVLQEAFSNLSDSVKNSLQDLRNTFQTQNQSVQQLIDEQQRALTTNLSDQQNAVNERLSQFDNPFEGLKETFVEGLNNIKDAFEQQKSAINEIFIEQNKSFKEALQVQNNLFLQEMRKSQQNDVDIQKIKNILEAISHIDVQSASTVPIHDNTSKSPKKWLWPFPKKK